MALFKWILLLSLFTSSAEAVIYGADDRVEILKGSILSKGPAESVAVMVGNTLLKSSEKNMNSWNMELSTLKETWGICSAKKFSDRPSQYVACTGFLVAPDVLMTAGHCMVNFGISTDEKNAFCSAFSWVFDYQVDQDGKVQTEGISSDQIYGCEKVIKAVHNSEVSKEGSLTFRDDYALIRLNKKSSRKPLRLAQGPSAVGESLAMIGFPLGAPQMRSRGRLLSQEGQYFRASIDSFDGNSGSPVFNGRDEVVGLLVRGYPESLIEDKVRGCSVFNRCDEGAHGCTEDQKLTSIGEHVQSILSVPELSSVVPQMPSSLQRQ